MNWAKRARGRWLDQTLQPLAHSCSVKGGKGCVSPAMSRRARSSRENWPGLVKKHEAAEANVDYTK